MLHVVALRNGTVLLGHSMSKTTDGEPLDMLEVNGALCLV